MNPINHERAFEVFTFGRNGRNADVPHYGEREDTALMIDVNIISDEQAARIEGEFDSEIIVDPNKTDLEKFDALVKLIRREIKIAAKEHATC